MTEFSHFWNYSSKLWVPIQLSLYSWAGMLGIYFPVHLIRSSSFSQYQKEDRPVKERMINKEELQVFEKLIDVLVLKIVIMFLSSFSLTVVKLKRFST
jgi:hypothetical protein